MIRPPEYKSGSKKIWFSWPDLKTCQKTFIPRKERDTSEHPPQKKQYPAFFQNNFTLCYRYSFRTVMNSRGVPKFLSA